MRQIRWTFVAVALAVLAVLAGCSGRPTVQPPDIGHDSESPGHGM